jgi:hypothetical protein
VKSWGRADTQRAFDLIESAKFARNGDRFTFSFGEQQSMTRPRPQALTTNQMLALGGVALVLALIVLR